MDDLNPVNAIAQMSLDNLAQHCAEETQHYLRKEQSRDIYCLELMRQALYEKLSEAFTHIYRVYEPLVRHWIARHQGFEQTNEPVDYFVGIAFSNFYFATRGEKFKRFTALAQLLTYLKRCVYTSIAQHLRDSIIPHTVPLETAPPITMHQPEKFLALADVWNRITTLLPAEADQFLVQCIFSQGLKPADVVELKLQWATARQVSVDLQRIRRILRKDDELRELLSTDSSDSE